MNAAQQRSVTVRFLSDANNSNNNNGNADIASTQRDISALGSTSKAPAKRNNAFRRRVNFATVASRLSLPFGEFQTRVAPRLARNSMTAAFRKAIFIALDSGCVAHRAYVLGRIKLV